MATEPHPPTESAPEDRAGIQAEIQDLKQLVKLTLKQRNHRRPGKPPNPLLFLAPDVSPLPASVLEDRSLTHRDKLIWLHLRLRLSDSRYDHTLPGLRELADRMGIGGKDTVARSLVMLRCRRYLSVCATAWHGGGRKVGTAYALHAPRLLVADALFLDPEYAGFVDNLRDHPSVRLRQAARDEIVALAGLGLSGAHRRESSRQRDSSNRRDRPSR